METSWHSVADLLLCVARFDKQVIDFERGVLQNSRRCYLLSSPTLHHATVMIW